MHSRVIFSNAGIFVATASALTVLAVVPAFAQTDDYGTGSMLGTYCPQLFQTVLRGSSGSQVLELQKFLSDYYDISPTTIQTGYFGRMTQQHVAQFQKEQGLPAYGIAGSMTRAAIARICGTKPPVVISPQPASPSGSDANAIACGIPRCSDTASCLASLQTVKRSAIDAGSVDFVHAGACVGKIPCQIGRDEVSGKSRHFDEGESTKCISQMDGELCISDARYVCRAGAWEIEGGVPKTENKCKTFVNACNICSRSGVGEVMSCKSANPCSDGAPRCVEYFETPSVASQILNAALQNEYAYLALQMKINNALFKCSSGGSDSVIRKTMLSDIEAASSAVNQIQNLISTLTSQDDQRSVLSKLDSLTAARVIHTASDAAVAESTYNTIISTCHVPSGTAI